MIAFTVPGLPQGKGRARMTRSGHAYTPEKTRSYEGAVAMAAAAAMAGQPPLDGPLWIQVAAWFPKPKSWSKKQSDGTRYHSGKPDADNILKAVSDACNGVLYRDDSQIAQATICKQYTTDGSACVAVLITKLGEP